MYWKFYLKQGANLGDNLEIIKNGLAILIYYGKVK